MKAPTKTIETPFGKHKVEIKEWITGREREYIDSAFTSGLSANPRVAGKEINVNIDKMDIDKLTNLAKHRAIETFVVSIDGKTDKIVDEVLEMHEHDTAFILQEIDNTGKKKETPGR